MDKKTKEIAKDFHDGMQKIANESGCTISAGMSGEEMKVIAEPQEKTEQATSIEIKLPPLHLACMMDDMRPNMALIEIINGVASATNGHIIVKIDLNKHGHLTKEQIEFINGKHIHMETWKEMHKCDVLNIDGEGLHITNKGITKNIDFSEPLGEFFKIQTVIDDVKLKGQNAVPCIGMNASFIEIIRKVFGTELLAFSFTGEGKGIVVIPTKSDMDYAWAMIMPIMLIEINRYFI